MEGALIAGLALLLGGGGVAALAVWNSSAEEEDSRLWAMSNGFESWLYGGGGAIAALLGGLVLFDHLT